MKVDRDEILRIARLAQLHFEEAELERFSGEFAQILEYFQNLQRLDLTQIEPTAHAGAAAAAGVEEHRADETRPGLPVEEVLREAPEKANGHFLVPRVVG